MQVRPGESIKLAYLIGDTTDANTYYVKSVMRDSATGAIIATTNLSGVGRRFTGSIKAPADTTGRGRWIDITHTVYDDAGYTVGDATYPEQVFSYIVQERISAALLAAGATAKSGGDMGPADVDYKRIQKMLTSAIQVLRADLIQELKNEPPEPVELPEVPTADSVASRVLEAFTGAHAAHADGLSILREEIRGVTLAVADVSSQLFDLADRIPELVSEKPDFEPILKSLEALDTKLEKASEGLAADTILGTIEEGIQKGCEDMQFYVPVRMGPGGKPEPNAPQEKETKAEDKAEGGTEEPAPVARPKRDFHKEARDLMSIT